MTMNMRAADITAETRRPAGRSTVTVCCPYCLCETEARLWSLAGGGKRCDCGALMMRNNADGTVWAQAPEPEGSE